MNALDMWVFLCSAIVHCPSADAPFKYLRWQIMECLGCVQEVLMFGMAVWLVWGLKTSRGNKATVMTAFGFRLL